MLSRSTKVTRSFPMKSAPTMKASAAPDVSHCGNHEDIPDAGEHEGGEGIVDHGLVVDGEHLLRDRGGRREESGGHAACQNDAFRAILLALAFIQKQPDTPDQSTLREIPVTIAELLIHEP